MTLQPMGELKTSGANKKQSKQNFKLRTMKKNINEIKGLLLRRKSKLAFSTVILIILGMGIYSSCTKEKVGNTPVPAASQLNLSTQIIQGLSLTLPSRMEMGVSSEALKVNIQFVNALSKEIKSETGKEYVETLRKIYAFYEKNNGHFVYDEANHIGTREDAISIMQLKAVYGKISDMVPQQEMDRSLELREVYKYVPTDEEVSKQAASQQHSETVQASTGYSCSSPVCGDGTWCKRGGCQIGANCICVGRPGTASCTCTTAGGGA